MYPKTARINRHFEIPDLAEFWVEAWKDEPVLDKDRPWHCVIHWKEDVTSEYKQCAIIIGDTLEEVQEQVLKLLPSACCKMER